MPNEDIRKFMKVHNVFIWEVALAFSVSEMTIYRWLRKPLTREKEKLLVDTVKSIADVKETNEKTNSKRQRVQIVQVEEKQQV